MPGKEDSLIKRVPGPGSSGQIRKHNLARAARKPAAAKQALRPGAGVLGKAILRRAVTQAKLEIGTKLEVIRRCRKAGEPMVPARALDRPVATAGAAIQRF